MPYHQGEQAFYRVHWQVATGHHTMHASYTCIRTASVSEPDSEVPSCTLGVRERADDA